MRVFPRGQPVKVLIESEFSVRHYIVWCPIRIYVGYPNIIRDFTDTTVFSSLVLSLTQSLS